jgi:hypothetical protein
VWTNCKATSTASQQAIAQKIASYRMTNNVVNVPFEQKPAPSYANGGSTNCSDIQINDVNNNPIDCTDYSTQISATTINDAPLSGNEIVQKITVKVIHGTKVVTSLQNYKYIADNTN